MMISLKMTGSVGDKGKNSSVDIYLIKALLNVYARGACKKPLQMNNTFDADSLSLLNDFQKNVVRMGIPDGLVSSNQRTFKVLVSNLKNSFRLSSITSPTRGGLTWDSEGKEGGLFHSRILHVPSSKSGLTLGRGYDMKGKSSTRVQTELVKAGLSLFYAQKLSKGARLSGTNAERFIVENDLLDFQITAPVQLALFNIAYSYEESEVKRICNKGDTVKKYGTVDFNLIPKSVLELFVDLKYRGDYSPQTRSFLQEPLSKGDISNIKMLMNDRSKWAQVPVERFNMRSKFASLIPLGVTP
ncbi:hypothetical protein H5119_04700 [Pseudoalteromonas sp. SG45-5]|uniref:hypothetical protein n=1 Tax=unclassified Pseudoalteromonas TaxID=194690 RepID=UPI0016038E88|nr:MULTISPECIES: hypothetical protein [unclassified Pseudoalteromonas]MBB1384848.1 hypothetical protein [Pseudoalteromonas sp. SG45-5]MBB1392756.1 hypothetical protein [Pseudoalteromonas sp. SG44-4]MBB1445682.1 hypothetical protein [Pseudoalteromonas sp. SG41-6]